MADPVRPEAATTPLMIFALSQEARPFLARCRRVPGVRVEPRRSRSGSRRLPGWSVLGLLPEAPLAVRLTGPGCENVLEALAEEDPSEIIHPGFAGAVDPALRPLDLRAVARVRRAAEVLEVPPSPSLRASFGHLPAAAVVTVPGVVSAADKRTMHAHGAADLCDMETHAAAACCLEEGIPYTGIRIVTDARDEDVPREIIESYDGRRFRTGLLLYRCVGRPALALELLRLRRVARRAAARLAEELVEGLRSGGDGRGV